MSTTTLTLIYFLYGLAFFSMGLAITLEIGHGSDVRLRHALRALAVFGLIHGGHEWMEMFEILGFISISQTLPVFWLSIRVGILALSFLALGAFGASLVSSTESLRRWSILVPVGQSIYWAIGLLVLRGRFDQMTGLYVADVWTRYVLAIPSALLACAGLLALRRAFRQAGMVQFSRDSLWAAIAFLWYGGVGQLFTRATPLPPSTVINQDLFLQMTGFPIQLLRAAAAVVVAIFVIRFLRSSEVEIQRHIASLQAARWEEAQRRQALRGELLKRVVGAQEAERQRIARELHDETGQALTAIGLGLRGAGTSLKQDVEKTGVTLRKLEQMVAQALTELQRMIADLRPSHLDDLGLPAALRWYGKEIQTRAPLDVAVEVRGDPQPISSEVATALFRVAQEALTNVVRHAHAGRASVRLVFQPDAVSLAVEDDGVGFDPDGINGSKGTKWGLLGMEERAALLGGKLWLHSGPGRGTLVEVTIPYRSEQEIEVGDEREAAVGG
ncbi:MAG TPA: sensor histidine kinase [Anaerolineales bacterium]|nr:sensor histidine kinase [Anaerolineales bacterium]